MRSHATHESQKNVIVHGFYIEFHNILTVISFQTDIFIFVIYVECLFVLDFHRVDLSNGKKLEIISFYQN